MDKLNTLNIRLVSLKAKCLFLKHPIFHECLEQIWHHSRLIFQTIAKHRVLSTKNTEWKFLINPQNALDLNRLNSRCSEVAFFKSHNVFIFDGNVSLHEVKVLLFLCGAELYLALLVKILLLCGLHVEPLGDVGLETAVVCGVERKQLALY